jgi:hypothetical protein
MSKKVSINIGRIIIGVPLKQSSPSPSSSMSSGARDILRQILTGKYDDENGKEDEDEIASIEDIQKSLTKYVEALEGDLAEMGKEEHPEKITTFVDGYGDVNLVKAKEVLSARVADLKPILELVNTAIANEEARQESAEKASKKDS